MLKRIGCLAVSLLLALGIGTTAFAFTIAPDVVGTSYKEAAETLGAAEPKREYLSQLALRAGQAVIQSEIEGLALIKIIAETSYENN